MMVINYDGILLIRWDLIAGRIPGRSAREIERFWLMRINGDGKNKEDKIIDRAPPLHIFD